MRYLLDTCVISDFIKGEPFNTNSLWSQPINENLIECLDCKLETGKIFNY